jgi:hypothetical protein
MVWNMVWKKIWSQGKVMEKSGNFIIEIWYTPCCTPIIIYVCFFQVIDKKIKQLSPLPDGIILYVYCS